MSISQDEARKEVERIKSQHKAAANVAREKIKRIHLPEPSAKEEIKEISKISAKHQGLSKHQQYMDQLSKSGKSLAQIQQAWHKYYQSLPDKEKREVWNEFYTEHRRRRQKARDDAKQRAKTRIKAQPALAPQPAASLATGQTSILPPSSKLRTIKNDILHHVSERARKSEKNPRLHSLKFGLALGSLVIFILLFSFFNERFITPFIRPSYNVSATSIIVDPNQSTNVGPQPKIIIPKINVEAPVVYNQPSIDEKAIQKSLEQGVVHYAITPNPGEEGNAVIVGHSSSNILNSGKYKFAFLLLKSLENGDTFFIHKDGKRYVYKVHKKFVTSPTDFSVLDRPKDKKAIVTLITCDPPGLSTNRLIIQAEQIFPDPGKNLKSSVDPSQVPVEPDKLPSNSRSLWQRILDWF